MIKKVLHLYSPIDPGVPAHDDRDSQFAAGEVGLESVRVLSEDGNTLINSAEVGVVTFVYQWHVTFYYLLSPVFRP